MKKLTFLLALPAILAMQNVLAQTTERLTLSDPYPAAGEKIQLTYDPSATPVFGKKDITASVYFLDDKKYPVADVDLKTDGKLLKGNFEVNTLAKAFFIKINAGADIDDNDTKGYVYLVYKDKQPIQGAYANQAYMLSSGLGNSFAKIKRDVPEGIALYKKEFALYPQSQKEYQAKYYQALVGQPEYKAMVGQKITSLEKSNDEKDVMLAVTLLRLSKMKASADSLALVCKTRFPQGETVKNALITDFYNEKDIAKKTADFDAFVKAYPSTPDNNTVEDNLRLTLADTYLTKGDLANFYKQEALLKNKSNLPNTLNTTAWNWVLKGERLDDAEALSKLSLDIQTENINHPTSYAFSSPAELVKSEKVSYDNYADTYAMILFKTNKLAEALKVEQGVYDRHLVSDPAVFEDYVVILGANGQYAKAQEVAANSVRDGKSTEKLTAELKADYIKVKGSDAGYDTYLASLTDVAKNKARAEMLKTMINQTAPLFTLKDLDGNKVSLSDLKGKVVIVDFWATWCGPCKASFPGMQMAVNKYKDDPNVKFLFIDCWQHEAEEKYTPEVKKFIADNKYTFHVLLDEKGADGDQTKVVSTYGVDGIPTKFIIDKNGNIRFKYVGYSGSADGVLSEVSTMVDLAGNPPAIASSGAKANTDK